MSIFFVTGVTGSIYSNFVLEWIYGSDDPAISVQWPSQDEPTLSANDQQAKFLAQAGQFA
jgi:dTDP-4-dehydrorhamnose 3,5-epimerase-like enzyme